MANLETYTQYYPVQYDYVLQLPREWQLLPNIAIFEERIERGHINEELLSVTIGKGVIKQADVDIKKDSSNEDKSKYKLIKEGDLAYNKMRMWQGALGYSKYKGISSPAYIILKPKNIINPKYFHFLFRTKFYTNYSKRFSYGIVDDQLSLRYTHFKRMYSIVPPIETQNAIVEYLDRKNTQIDTFIAKKQRLIELLEEEKKGKIKSCYTNGLKKGLELKKTNEDWLESLPAHWEFKKLRHIANHVQRGSSPNYVDKSELIVISQASISSGIIDDTKFKFQKPDNIENFKGRLFKSDFLIASTGGGVLGKTIVFNRDGNYIADGHITIIRDSKNRFNPYFLFYLFSINYDFIEGYLGQGSTNQTELQRQWLRDLFLPYPSLEEQKEIVEHIQKISAEIDLAISKAEKEITAIQEYRQALIIGLVTGKYQVPQLQTATA